MHLVRSIIISLMAGFIAAFVANENRKAPLALGITSSFIRSDCPDNVVELSANVVSRDIPALLVSRDR